MDRDTEEKETEQFRIPMLLLNVSFQPGECKKCIEAMENPGERDMAMLEYAYFSGDNYQAVEIAEKYLHDPDLKIQLSARLVAIFANMALGRVVVAREGVHYFQKLAEQKWKELDEREIHLLLTGIKIMFHWTISKEEVEAIIHQREQYNESGRLFACYLMAHKAWQKAEYERVIGVAEAAIMLSKHTFPLFFIYLYLTAAAAAMNLRDTDRAELYFKKAWDLAEPDGFYAPIAEMQGCLQGPIEKLIRREYPEAYRQIMEITLRFRIGWKKLLDVSDTAERVHIDEIMENVKTDAETDAKSNIKTGIKEAFKPCSESDSQAGAYANAGAATDTDFSLEAVTRLTGMEYAVAELAGQGWSNQEIGDYFQITIRTVKYYMTSVFNKLNISSRRELSGKLPH